MRLLYTFLFLTEQRLIRTDFFVGDREKNNYTFWDQTKCKFTLRLDGRRVLIDLRLDKIINS